MKKKIKYFKPNQVITLIDLANGDSPFGTLIFKTPAPLPAPPASQSSLFFPEFLSLVDFGLLFGFIGKQVSGTLQKTSVRVLALNLLSATCIIIALLGVASFVYPYIASQINSFNQKSNASSLIQQATPSPEPQTTEFVLTIPDINLVSEVIPNVDIRDEEIYKQELKRTGVAHTKGTFLPNEDGPSLLFAHSTDTIFNVSEYNAKFFELPNMQPGDEIQIQYHGKKYTYKVADKKIVGPRDFQAIENSTSPLILMTCTPPGTDWQRLLIFADKVSEKAV